MGTTHGLTFRLLRVLSVAPVMARVVDRVLSLASGALCTSAWCTSALAQQPPLPPATHFVEIVGAFGQIAREERAVPLNLAVDWVGQWGSIDYSMQATAETSGGFRPTAGVQAEVNSSSNVQFNFRADSIIYYYVRIRPRGTPPPGSYSVPARAQARGEASGNALAQVRFNSDFPIRVETFGTNDLRSFDVSVPLTFYPSDPEANVTYVQLRAFARAYHNHPTYAASSQAYADPFFTFDQAEFDVQQGANTFPLVDHFEFEYSPYLINPPGVPTITTHPVGQSLCEGGAVTMNAAATSDAPMTYQWQLNGGALSDGDGFSGTTTSTLSIDPTLAWYAGNYECVFSNVAGSVTSNPAVLSVSTPVQITYPPQPLTVASGDPVTMTVYTGNGGPLSFQWRRNGGNLSDGGRISGATTANLVIDAAIFSDAGSYDVIVSNICDAVTSESALLTVTGCVADFNADTSVDFFDYLDFVAAFSASEPAADFNADTAIDFFDYLDFVAAFASGC